MKTKDGDTAQRPAVLPVAGALRVVVCRQHLIHHQSLPRASAQAYLECFCSPAHLQAVRGACDAANAASQRQLFSYQAFNACGNEVTNRRSSGVHAVTWGVFPDLEILQVRRIP